MRRMGAWIAGALALSLCGVMGCSGSSDEDDADGSGANGSGASGSGTGSEPGAGGAGSDGQPTQDMVPIEEVIPGGLAALRESACVGESVETELVPVVLQLIVDVSGSMNAPAPGSNDTKWNVTRNALVTAMDDLRQDSSVGVTFYPNMATSVNLEGPVSVNACIDTSDNVPIDVLGTAGSAQRRAIQTAFESAEANDMAGTPTHDAYNIALADLTNSPVSVARYMLLITDGQPTFSAGCVGTGSTAYPVDPQPILDAVGAARDQGIRTFVIGSPGSEATETLGDDARPWLSEAARLGGTALPGCTDSGPNYCHFDMTQQADFATALSEALLAITATLLCNYAISAPPEGMELDIEAVNVVYSASGGEDYLLVQNKSETCDLGWRLLPETGEIVVCGSTCDSLQADPGGRVEVLLGCVPFVQPVQ